MAQNGMQTASNRGVLLTPNANTKLGYTMIRNGKYNENNYQLIFQLSIEAHQLGFKKKEKSLSVGSDEKILTL